MVSGRQYEYLKEKFVSSNYAKNLPNSKSAKYDKVYTSKAKDKANKQWHRYNVKGGEHGRYYQLVAYFRWFMKDGSFAETSGVSANRQLKRRNVRIMKGEAFDSAAAKLQTGNKRLVPAEQIKSFRVKNVFLQKWSRQTALTARVGKSQKRKGKG